MPMHDHVIQLRIPRSFCDAGYEHDQACACLLHVHKQLRAVYATSGHETAGPWSLLFARMLQSKLRLLPQHRIGRRRAVTKSQAGRARSARRPAVPPMMNEGEILQCSTPR